MEERGMRVFQRPALRRPSMICGIDGWVDGGEASTGSARYLIDKLQATKFAELPITRFHVFQIPGYNSSRPHVKNQGGLVVEHRFPKNEFFFWSNPSAERDLIIMQGCEPNLRWEEYIDAVFTLAEEMAVERMYILGGVMDDTPHTREPNVYSAVSDPSLLDEIRQYAVQFSGYEGPGSLASSLVYLARERQVQAISLTARATYYPDFNLTIPRNPKTIRAVLKRLDALLSLNLDMSDLDREAEELERSFGQVVRQNARFHAYLKDLERNYVEVDYRPALEITGEDALRVAEELLRQSRGQGSDPADEPPKE